MIIGLTGTFGAGKDTVAEILAKHGFEHYSTGSGGEISLIAKEMNVEPTRDNLRELANQMRDKYGNDYLSRRVVEKRIKTDKATITGLRQPGEVEYLKAQPDFFLIAVNAPIEERFKRIKKRNRLGDPETMDELLEKEAKEMRAKNNAAQNISATIKMADYNIVNDGTKKDLEKIVLSVLSKIQNKNKH